MYRPQSDPIQHSSPCLSSSTAQGSHYFDLAVYCKFVFVSPFVPCTGLSFVPVGHSYHTQTHHKKIN